MPFLTVSTPDGQIFRFPFEDSIRIGRSNENDLVLPDPSVSRLHAMLERRGGDTYLIDLTSHSGTFLNDRRIRTACVVERGDSIQVGNTTLTYDASPQPPIRLGEISPFHPSDTLPLEKVFPTPTEPVALSRESDILRLVLAADEELTVQRPLAELYRKLLDLAHEAVPFDRGVVMTLEDGELVPQAQRDLTGMERDSIVVSSSITWDAIRSKQAILLEDLSARPDYQNRVSIVDQQIRSAMCVPLWDRHAVTGVVYLDSGRNSRPFNRRGLQVLTHLAHVAAVKLENKRLFDEAVRLRMLDEEIRRAAAIQSQFLPGCAPEIPGYGVHAVNRPCFTVGGDFFNYLPLGDRCYGLAIGDVAGHGLAASVLMCSFQAILGALAYECADPAAILDRINRVICQRVPVNRFITLFFGVLDTAEHTISYVNAGQNRPFLVSPGAPLVELDPSGLPLGITEDAEYTARAVALPPGGMLVCCSDGLTEQRNDAEEEFGAERLQAAAVAASAAAPDEIVARILGVADEHAGDVPNHDDITLLVLKRLGRGSR